jgi:transcriptional regulator with XRE-family HTH domain
MELNDTTIRLRPDRIADLMRELGIEQAGLARKAEIHDSYVYRLLLGNNPNVSAVILGRIARVLGTTLDYLVNKSADATGYGNTVVRHTEVGDAVAGKIDSLPADEREQAATFVSLALETWMKARGAGTVASKRQKLLAAFDSLDETSQADLIQAAEAARSGKSGDAGSRPAADNQSRRPKDHPEVPENERG